MHPDEPTGIELRLPYRASEFQTFTIPYCRSISVTDRILTCSLCLSGLHRGISRKGDFLRNLGGQHG